jgi:hypothetical protein
MPVRRLARVERPCERILAWRHKRACQTYARANQTVVISRATGVAIASLIADCRSGLGKCRPGRPRNIAQMDVTECKRYLQRER